MLQQLILFLGGDFYYDLKRTEYHLPRHLSKYYSVYCFEFPQFLKLVKVLTGKLHFIEKINSSLTVFHTFGILPFGRSFPVLNKVNHLLNYYILKLFFRKTFQNSLLISLTPELVYLIPRIEKIHQIIYYVNDEYTSLPAWSNRFQKKQFLSLENKLLKKVDKIIAVSPTLKDKYMKLGKRVYYFPPPAHLLPLRKIKDNRIPPDIKDIPKPIIGFEGAFFDWRIDIQLLLKALNFLPNVSFVFIGSLKIKNKQFLKELKSKHNFYYLGNKRLEEVPYYIKQFNVCLIPYKLNDYGRFAYPVKINEYLYIGRPVVTTALPAFKNLANSKLIYWAKSEEEFIKNIKTALKEELNLKTVEKMRKVALSHSWMNKINDFLSIINEK